jgi:hypothetical protein
MSTHDGDQGLEKAGRGLKARQLVKAHAGK